MGAHVDASMASSDGMGHGSCLIAEKGTSVPRVAKQRFWKN
ncbi:hypothetical protein QN400_03555 [Pseudomonas sp. RTC3]|nr:hypothetical protein [Pseudomonas sp. 5C2]MDY7565588.1 hypothetical protein [Pseudomonas sp. 5C2]MEB0061100.1 hypothetical protein [Pseudomonas sp. RTC3]MEB0242650.1 hypothetical protein [Pseudomonas sp. 5C2]